MHREHFQLDHRLEPRMVSGERLDVEGREFVVTVGVEEDLVNLAGFELLEGEDPSGYSHVDYFSSFRAKP